MVFPAAPFAPQRPILSSVTCPCPFAMVLVLLPGCRFAGDTSQSFWYQSWRAIAPPPWLGQAGRVATSRALHAEQRIRLPSSGTGNIEPRLSINDEVATSALWLHRLHQQKTPIFSAARSARVVGFLGSLLSTSRFLKPPMPSPLPIFHHVVHDLFYFSKLWYNRQWSRRLQKGLLAT